MIKILQFGEGNFLRTFVDLYFETLNQEGYGPYEVNILKPITFGNLSKFYKQNNKYHIILRGNKNNKTIEDVYKVNSVKNAIENFNADSYLFTLIKDKDLKIIVSNTTEAGIAYNGNDKIYDYDHITYPGKLTSLLYLRYKANLPGLHILPVELIENNATELAKCVDKYITLWNLGEDFRKYNNTQNVYSNTLVDRIVSGYPRDAMTKDHLTKLIGEEDELMSVGEPFGLWVIEKKGNIANLIKDGTHNIDIILADDITYYKKRKVRVLNGSHTNLVPISLYYGKETVFDVMKDAKLSKFVYDTLNNDIIPFVSNDINMTKKFADEVMERFLNPFLNHQLTSIALNSISKWKARDLCSYVDYYHKHHQIPKYLTIGLSYLIYMYQHIEKDGDKYICKLPKRTFDVKDDLVYLEYFKKHSVHDFLADKSIWDISLAEFNGLEETIDKYLTLINEGKELI
ncbi:MAG: tagaturonate reductase [Bacilli bacterium]|nr:tagaturonate reductase [Bacilli bacterium]